jgi:hypothetical protein
MSGLKAKPFGGGGGAVSRGAKKRGRGRSQSAFNGVVVLTAAEYDSLEQCQTNPAEPTEAARRGATLLRKLYG